MTLPKREIIEVLYGRLNGRNKQLELIQKQKEEIKIKAYRNFSYRNKMKRVIERLDQREFAVLEVICELQDLIDIILGETANEEIH